MKNNCEKIPFLIFFVTCSIFIIFIINGCVSSTDALKIKSIKEPSVEYPRLTASKVQPPNYGCYFGFFPSAGIEDNPKLFNRIPAISIPYVYIARDVGMAIDNIKRISSIKAIPLIYLDIEPLCEKYDFSNLTTNINARMYFEKFAKSISEIREPIFLLPLWEINATFSRRIWHQYSAEKQIRLWKYMWNIFEEYEANNYVTWIWEIIPPEMFKPGVILKPESFYPGDKYVDWIGISVVSGSSNGPARNSFRYLFSKTYMQLRQNHPNKPIMIAELTRRKDSSQYKWFDEAFKTIKSVSGIKAVCVWDNFDEHPLIRQNNLLTEETLKSINKVFSDPYFISAQ